MNFSDFSCKKLKVFALCAVAVYVGVVVMMVVFRMILQKDHHGLGPVKKEQLGGGDACPKS